MLKFIQELKAGIDRSMRDIEAEDNILRKSMMASNIYECGMAKLKEFIVGYDFISDEEEILFFKEMKPRLFSHLIYHSKVYNIELNRPTGSEDVQRSYLNKNLDDIQDFVSKRLEFYRYYRSGHTHLDYHYFKRYQEVIEPYRDVFFFERDPRFSTCADFKVSKILSNDMLEIYLKTELENFNYRNGRCEYELPRIRPTWTANKTDLIELLYALDSQECFDSGRISLNQLAQYFGLVFNVELGQISRNFQDMKTRNKLTPFLDRLKEKLLKRMEETGRVYKRKS